jgi:hypothetical protein
MTNALHNLHAERFWCDVCHFHDFIIILYAIDDDDDEREAAHDRRILPCISDCSLIIGC